MSLMHSKIARGKPYNVVFSVEEGFTPAPIVARAVQPDLRRQRWRTTNQDVQTQMQEFTIILNGRPSDALGVEIEFPAADGTSLRIKRIMKLGLLPLWNKSNPLKTVKIGDRIIEVNGQRGLAANLIAQLRQFRVQEVVIRRQAALDTWRAQAPSVPWALAAGEPAAAAGSRAEQADLPPRQAVGGASAQVLDGGQAPAEGACSSARDLRPEPGQARPVPGRPRGPLEGRWLDRCGVVGTVVGSTLHWAHQAWDSNGTSEVVLAGGAVRIGFLGQTLSGVLQNGDIVGARPTILWQRGDVWWRSD